MPRPFPKPTDIEVAAFARAAPSELPASYLRFMADQGAVQLDVPSVGSGLVWLWELNEVLSLNAGYGFKEFAPSLFGFGSDGAGELFVFDLAGPGQPRIGTVSATVLGLDEDDFRVVASSFDEFAKLLETGTDAREPSLLEDLSVRIYCDPLQTRWADRRHLPDVLRTVVLLIDLDTELHMNGLSGLVENSVGEFLPEMISALDTIGAGRTADALRNTQAIMAKHGITHAMLRSHFADLQPFDIMTFDQLHGDAAAAMLRELDTAVSPQLYLHHRDGERPMDLLEKYVALHQSELRALTAQALVSDP